MKINRWTPKQSVINPKCSRVGTATQLLCKNLSLIYFSGTSHFIKIHLYNSHKLELMRVTVQTLLMRLKVQALFSSPVHCRSRISQAQKQFSATESLSRKITIAKLTLWERETWALLQVLLLAVCLAGLRSKSIWCSAETEKRNTFYGCMPRIVHKGAISTCHKFKLRNKNSSLLTLM